MNFHRLFICSHHFDVSILYYALSQRPDCFLSIDCLSRLFSVHVSWSSL